MTWFKKTLGSEDLCVAPLATADIILDHDGKSVQKVSMIGVITDVEDEGDFEEVVIELKEDSRVLTLKAEAFEPVNEG